MLNLDENSVLVQAAEYRQDFREVHSYCSFRFASPDKADFGNGETVFFLGQEWDIASCKRTRLDGAYSYDAMGYPKGSYRVVSEKHSNAQDLARGLKTDLAQGSTNARFDFPLRNVLYSHLLYKYRWESIEKNLNSLKDALFLYHDFRGLTCRPYGSIQADPGSVFAPISSGTFSFVQGQGNFFYTLDSLPSPFKYSNVIGNLIGDMVEYSSMDNLGFAVGNRYKLDTGDGDLDGMDRLVLVRQSYTYKKSPFPWTITFGQLEL